MRYLLLLIAVIFLLFMLIICLFGRRISMIANENIYVYASIDAESPFNEIKIGDVVPVVKCQDLKHYISPKIRLQNGEEGYVKKGNFKLIHHPLWAFKSSSLSFTCE